MDETQALCDGLTGSFHGLVSIASHSTTCGCFLATHLQSYPFRLSSHCRGSYEHLLCVYLHFTTEYIP